MAAASGQAAAMMGLLVAERCPQSAGQDERDHYAMLGVSPGATTAEIKAAYRSLVKRTIPMPVGDRHDPGAQCGLGGAGRW